MTLIFKWLKQPLVLGYIVAGFLASPNMPYMPSVTDIDNIQLWSDIGVIFLLFALGLEFSFRKILKMGAAPIIAASAVIVAMMTIGIATGQAFGWSRMDCIFLGGMLAMSSTTIIFKAFDDMGLRQQRFAGMVLSVLIIEDILAIVLMVMLSTLAVSQKFEGMQMVTSITKLVFFLVIWFLVGIYIIPQFLRRTRTLMGNETMLVVALALCFGMVVLASTVGFSPAFGAFIMGSILAETLDAERIEHLVEPVKNLFGAIFFVSVGMMVDVNLIIQYAVPIVCIIAAIMVGQTVFGTIGFLLAGQPLKVAMQCSFSLTQIGEFAFILATLGTSLGVTSDYLYPIVVAVSVFTTFTTPYMIRLAAPAYEALEPHLPSRLRQYLNRYATGAPSVAGRDNLWREFISSLAATLLIYGVLCVAIIVMMSQLHKVFLGSRLAALDVQFTVFGFQSSLVNILFAVTTILLLSPFLRTIMVKHNRDSQFQTLWNDNNFNRAQLIALQLLRILIVAAMIGYVLGQNLSWNGGLIITVVAIIIFIILQNRALRHPTQVIEQRFVDNLNQRQTGNKPKYAQPLVEHDIHLSTFTIPVGSSWAAQTLAQLNLGKKYGVHVASILRGEQRINIPSGKTLLLPTDRLQVIGSDHQLATFGRDVEAAAAASASAKTAEDDMVLVRIRLPEGSSVDGKTLQDSGIRENYRCLVVALQRDGETALTSPGPKTFLSAGDIVWLVGEPNDIAKVQRPSCE